jgi:hypothetical protein
MPVERREQATRVELIYGSTAGRMNPVGFGGRRQLSMGGTSRISREAYVRFCERLGVKFPGPTRRERKTVERAKLRNRPLCGYKCIYPCVRE